MGGIGYVERNPVRAKMVTKAEEHPWSSAAVYCGIKSDEILNKTLIGRNIANKFQVGQHGWLMETILRSLRCYDETLKKVCLVGQGSLFHGWKRLQVDL